MIALESSETRSKIPAAFSDMQRRLLNKSIIVRGNYIHPFPKITEAKEAASLGNHCMFKGTALSITELDLKKFQCMLTALALLILYKITSQE